MVFQDLHAHTYYSFDSDDRPEKVIETAIAGGIKTLGITDHNHGVGLARKSLCYYKGTDLSTDYEQTLVRYFDHINLLKDKYRNKINILRGIEVATCVGKDNYALPENADISFFDYCLVEGLDKANSITKGDIFAFAKRCGCTTGIAHTDLFAFIKSIGEEPFRYFRKLAEHNIFWEINVNLDSSHGFKAYDYATEFLKNKEQQDVVKKSGVRLSVGFDSHAIREYKPERIKSACTVIKNAGIHLVFEGI
ncbi:MAG: PHP domain-containing protein [Clostridia bacterium]|nr:PHP domain-containing protein [Clostridia bacterium]